jgi:hypothetical protein
MIKINKFMKRMIQYKIYNTNFKSKKKTKIIVNNILNLANKMRKSTSKKIKIILQIYKFDLFLLYLFYSYMINKNIIKFIFIKRFIK